MQSWGRDAATFYTPPKTNYSPPEKKLRRKSGYKPTDCKEYEVISNLGTRDAYRRIEAYINECPSLNTCTIEANNQVKLWKATGLPVKLTKTTQKTIFFHSVELEPDLDY